MKNNLIILLFILSFSLNTKAQVNLVSNGYFEIHDTCPAWGISNNSQIVHATGWFVSNGSPDYWNACSNGVPYAEVGYQQDCCGGGGYAGMYIIVSINTPGDDIGREYMGIKLLDTLKVGHKYLASMYVSRSNDCNYSIKTIGMLFTDTAIVFQNSQQANLINTNPQVESTIVLSDTLNWILIQDTISAIGNETYLTIGNFRTTATSDTVSGTCGNFGDAYYYIDGVSVYDVATLGIQQNRNNVELSVYPNPANNKITVEANNITEIKLFDILGNQILSTKQKEINVSNVNEGVYFIQVQANQSTYTQKIIVQH